MRVGGATLRENTIAADTAQGTLAMLTGGHRISARSRHSGEPPLRVSIGTPSSQPTPEAMRPARVTLSSPLSAGP